VEALSAETLTKLADSLGMLVLVLAGRMLVLRYLGRRIVDPDAAYRARGRGDRIWRALLDALAQTPTVELAYPSVRTFLPDTLRLEQPG
jgi:hypothetical protein